MAGGVRLAELRPWARALVSRAPWALPLFGVLILIVGPVSLPFALIWHYQDELIGEYKHTWQYALKCFRGLEKD